MENEIWKPIPSQPGMLASSFGRVKLPDGICAMPNGGTRKYEPKPTTGTVAKANKKAMHKYYRVFQKERGNMKVHRLVCEAFHGPAPFPKAVVIHLDENALNNRPENLKWGTQKENLNMPKIKAYHRSRRGEKSAHAIARRNRS